MIQIQWVTTQVGGRAGGAGQRGWVRHAIMVSDSETFGAFKWRRAECGIYPRHGWGFDMFIEVECKRCRAKLDRK